MTGTPPATEEGKGGSGEGEEAAGEGDETREGKREVIPARLLFDLSRSARLTSVSVM